MCGHCSSLLHAKMVEFGVVRLAPPRQVLSQKSIPKQPALILGGQPRKTWVRQKSFQSQGPASNRFSLLGRVSDAPSRPRMVKVPVPPTDQWVHAAQKPRPEKEAVGETPAELKSSKLTRTLEDAEEDK